MAPRKQKTAPLSGWTTIPLEQLVECPLNPRKHFDEQKLQELAESIRQVGVLQALVVRPDTGGSGDPEHQLFEVVCGARRLRAARMADQRMVPVEIRGLTDDQVLDVMCVENLQREDLDPLEEADAVALLRGRLEVAELAARIGRSETWVYQRLRLHEVEPAIRELVEEGRIGVAGALRIAQVDASIRTSIIEWMQDPRIMGAFPLHTIEEQIIRNTPKLERAPWDLDDAGLVSGVGACTECPLRSSRQLGIFDEASHNEDRCLNKPCWDGKMEAHHERRRAEVVAAGGRVIGKEKASEVVHQYGYLKDDWLDLNGHAHTYGDDQQHGSRTWRDLLAEVGATVTPNIVQVRPGEWVEFIDKEELAAAIREKYPRTSRSLVPAATPEEKEAAKAEAAKRREENKKRTQLEAHAIVELVAAASSSSRSPFRIICRGLLDWQGQKVAERRKCKREDLVALVENEDTTTVELRALAVELAVTGWDMHQKGSDFQRARTYYGLIESAGNDDQVEEEDLAKCRICECTEDSPCEGGCEWVEDPEGLGDLCSACLPEVEAMLKGADAA